MSQFIKQCSYLLIQSCSSVSEPVSSPKSVARSEWSPATLIFRPNMAPLKLALHVANMHRVRGQHRYYIYRLGQSNVYKYLALVFTNMNT